MLPMVRIILASLFRKSATLPFPAAPVVRHDSVRGHIALDCEACIYCGLCQRKCPTGTIVVNRAEKEWSLEPFDCIVCGACVEACPKKCLHMQNTLSHPAYTRRSRTVARDA